MRPGLADEGSPRVIHTNRSAPRRRSRSRHRASHRRLVVPIAAATTSVTGSLTFRERIALTPEAVAIVTIIDTTAAPDAGVIIGEQVINGPTAVPIDFSVLIEADTIDQTHAYALYATIIDGPSTWHNVMANRSSPVGRARAST